MNTARISPAAAVVFDVPSDEDTVMGARVYVAGGKSTDGHRFSSVESYDPPNDEWFECAPMKEPRSDAMAFSQGSRFYVVGGENGDAYAEDDGILRTVEVYDEDLGSPHFEYGPPMPSPRCAAASGLIDGKFYVAGGRGPQFEMLTSTVVFDVETQEWSHLAEMPEPVEHGASAVVDGKLYVAGGFSPEFSDEIFIYDPATDTWEKSKHVMRGACHTVADIMKCMGYEDGEQHSVFNYVNTLRRLLESEGQTIVCERTPVGLLGYRWVLLASPAVLVALKNGS